MTTTLPNTLASGPPKHLMPFLWHFIMLQRPWFILLLLAHLGWAVDWTIMPYLFQRFVGAVIHYDGDRMAAWGAFAAPALTVLGFWLTVEILYRSSDFLASRTYPRFEATIRMAMVEYMRHHSYTFFANHLSGDLSSKIDDITEASTRIMQLLITLFIPAAVGVTIATIMFSRLHPLFGIVACGWFCLHLGICLIFAKACNRLSVEHSASKNKINGQIVDSFANITAVKLFARMGWEWQHIKVSQQQEQAKHHRVLDMVFKIRLILGVCCYSFMGVGMMMLMISQWQKNHITGVEFGYIFYASWGICVMAWISGIELPNFFKEIGKCQQALIPIQKAHDVTDSEGAQRLHVSKGDILFDNVTFHYQRNHNLFENKHVHISAGSKVGLVGFSGSGKTTFVNLILRFFDVEAGRILIDGQDIAFVTQESLHEAIAMIPQDTSLFHRSLMDNIRYGNIDATDEEVIIASKRAHCHEFISQLPQGYDSEVGERGVKLSGGQRQRIAIARAMLKNAPILILDEATSALDSVTEKHIQEGLHSLMQGRTTIVIAHRLSTLSEMDRILVFDKGHVIEDGTHEQLLKINGHYARMWHMQAGGFLPEIPHVT
ncbi:MAG: ABC transporter ATP-binding protein [Alphaproteobacteria bacterium]|nr:ABC transporter ATP-binding protein [Alphaproteobacteria bacterium]